MKSPTTTGNEQTTSAPQKRKRVQQYFSHWTREEQLQAFFAWLPQELHDVPGINWTDLPVQVMGYCVRIIRNSPDATVLALAIGVMSEAGGATSLYNMLQRLTALFRTLRSACGMKDLSDLRNDQIWNVWLASVKKTEGTRGQLKVYTACATGHYPSYLLRLGLADRTRMQPYALPPLPPHLLKKQFPHKSITAAQQAKRKESSDVLVPLYPVLRQMVRFRKQLAERTLQAIREARKHVEAGEAVLPYTFSHTDMIPEINRDARTVSEVQIVGREVTMHFTLWDKPTWVLRHRDRYAPATVYEAERRRLSYAPEHNVFFVQFHGEAADLLWFGDLIEHRLLQTLSEKYSTGDEYAERLRLARHLGFTNGCICERPAVLNPGSPWFSEVGHRNGDFVFEPEALYRGVLFGATLAMIALSNGSRLSELLQVSWNKERRVTRTETVVVLGEDGLPRPGPDGKPLTKQIKIHLQYLLPKGAKTEEERQLFPLSKECMRLLGEIKAMLEREHGEIPVVSPSRRNGKYEHLSPERYLFQWNATPDGQFGSLSPGEVQTLLRFMFHGQELSTTAGKPIRVSVHILRHVMSTHARHYRNVPSEAIAYFFLHHRLRELTGREPSLSEMSEYYTQMTGEQRFALIRTDLDEQEELDRMLLQAAPTARDLAQKNADLQAVYDEWHTLHPTALGNCGCPGLCPRGNERSLCLGCSYHVEDPEKLGAALAWRASYTEQARIFELQGNDVDARQARIKVQQLDDMINVMRMQLQEEAAGRYIPVFKVLPSPYRGTEENNEEAN